MAKTLVIRGADFSANALDTVIIESPVPCTGITLDQSTLDIGYGLSDVLTATVSPANTTDPIVWTSSDTNVATVSNGTVTAVSAGNAIITARCGSYSATCSVSVTLAWTKVAGQRLAGVTTYSGGGGVGYLDSGSRYGSFVSSVGTLTIQPSYYPYKIPDGMKRVKITRNSTASNINIYRIQFYSMTVSSTTTPACAQLVEMYTSSDAAFTDDVYIGTIPQYDGFPTIDGIAISVALSSGTFSENDFSGISIEFLPEV